VSGIALTTPVNLGQDSTIDAEFMGINFKGGRVFVRLSGANGAVKEYIIGPGGIESIAALVATVPNFAGLRVAILQHLQTLDATLSGSVT